MALFNSDKSARQGQPQQPTPEQLKQMQQSAQAVKANPSSFLHENFGVTVPQEARDPYQIMDHLAYSGQLNRAQMQMYQRFRRWMARR